LDSIKSGYIQLTYPRSYLKTAQQQQAHPAFHQPSKGLDSSKLEHTWFNKKAFIRLKEYLASPPVLCQSLLGTPLHLYFAVTDREISSVIVQEQNKAQKPVYFVSKVLQGPETCYQAIEKVAFVVVFAVWRLRHYFQSFIVIVMTNLPIRMVLQKPDIASQMVRCAVELSAFDVQYEPRGTIKGQVYADFLVELSPEATQPNGNDL